MGLLQPEPNYLPLPDRCPNCERDTALRLETRQMAWPEWTMNLAPPFREYMVLNVWRCTYCGQTTLVRATWDAAEEQSRPPREVRIVWPERAPRELPTEAAEAMRSLYREASVAEF